MKIKILSIFFTILLFLLNGCPPPKEAVDTEVGDCGVSNLQVDVADKMMNVSWQNNCEKTITGYNIYISESSDSDDKPFNHTPFDGDTNPEDGIENFEAKNLENGKKYYVSVKILNPNNTESTNSNKILAVCGPREEIEIAQRYKSENDGYSFDQNSYVSADNLANDFYYYAKDGVDYISSPHKLDGFLKNNKLGKLSFKGDFQDLRADINKNSVNPSDDKIVVKVNDWIQITTADNKSALLKILGFSGTEDERKIKLFVAYSPIKGELIF